MKKKTLIVITLLLLLTGCKPNLKNQNQTTNVEISAYYLNENIPEPNVQIIAKNYQTVLNKIKTGDFTKKDFEHYSFDEIQKAYSFSKQIVTLPNGLRFGKNIKNNSSDAEQIIKYISFKTMDYLDFLNNFDNSSVVVLTTPENKRHKFTNANGIAVGTVKKGFTIFVNSEDPKKLVLKTIKKKGTIYVGNTQPINPQIHISGAEKKRGKYSIDFGKKIQYHIPVNKVNQIQIKVTPHFIIDNTNIPIKKEKNLIENKYFVESFLNKNENFNENKIAEGISTLDYTKLILFDVAQFQGKELIIEGHITSSVDYNVAEKVSGKSHNISVQNQRITQGIVVSSDDNYFFTPLLYSYGINFVSVLNDTHQLYSRAEYSLIRKNKHNQEWVFQKNGNSETTWIKLNKKNKKETIANHTLKSGYIYYTDSHYFKIPYNMDLWNYNPKKQEKANNALIKFRGLSKNYTYRIVLNKSAYEIKDKSVANNFKLDSKSIKSAKDNDYQINGFINDQKYGQEEYNAIHLKKQHEIVKENINPKIKLFLALGLFGIIILTLCYLILKKSK